MYDFKYLIELANKHRRKLKSENKINKFDYKDGYKTGFDNGYNLGYSHGIDISIKTFERIIKNEKENSEKEKTDNGPGAPESKENRIKEN